MKKNKRDVSALNAVGKNSELSRFYGTNGSIWRVSLDDNQTAMIKLEIMGTTVTLDKRHFNAASKKARELGTTPETFIESLIDAATMTFDEVLAPVRKGFAKSGVSEDELDAVVTAAENPSMPDPGGNPANDRRPGNK